MKKDYVKVLKGSVELLFSPEADEGVLDELERETSRKIDEFLDHPETGSRRARPTRT